MNEKILDVAFILSELSKARSEEGEKNAKGEVFINLADVSFSPRDKQINDSMRTLMHMLTLKEIYKIEALMIVGRGWDEETFEETYNNLLKENDADSESQQLRNNAVDYIISKGPLHKYLKNGVEKYKASKGQNE